MYLNRFVNSRSYDYFAYIICTNISFLSISIIARLKKLYIILHISYTLSLIFYTLSLIYLYIMHINMSKYCKQEFSIKKANTPMKNIYGFVLISSLANIKCLWKLYTNVRSKCMKERCNCNCIKKLKLNFN